MNLAFALPYQNNLACGTYLAKMCCRIGKLAESFPNNGHDLLGATK